MAGSVAAWTCCSPFDASMGECSLAAVPRLAGASCLQRGCTAALLVHGCSHHAPLQSSCTTAILMGGCNHLAQLQSSCTSAITMHGYNPLAQLQSPCMAAILVDGCNHLAQLQCSCAAAILMHGCAGVALGRCKGIDYRGLAAGAEGNPMLISQSSPAPPCLSPGQRGSLGTAALGLEQAVASSSATPCQPPCTSANY